MTFAVAIVTHRNEATIAPCVDALLTSPLVSAVRIVDNHSDDDTVSVVSRLASRDARVRFVANEDNPGFGAGVNQAVAALPAEFDGSLLILNPDCVMDADALASLSEIASRENPALIGTTLIDADGAEDPNARRNDLKFWPSFMKLFGQRGYQFFIPRSQSVQDVQAISGAVMCLPLSLFRQLGGFDEAYRLHAEDLDLCIRVRQAGARVLCANDIRVLHLRSVSSRKRPFFVEWNKHRGLARYFAKYEARELNLVQRLIVYAIVWLRFPVALFRAALKSRG